MSGASLPRAFSAITDDEGRFVVAGVPSGTLTIVATKPGYLAGVYGLTRPGRGAMPFLLSDGGSAAVSIALTRASVLAGTITSADGGPAAGVAVFAIDARNPAATIGVPAPSDCCRCP